MSLRMFRPASGPGAICSRLIHQPTRPANHALRCTYSSTAAPPRRDRPFRMAVVGSGPAGFYTAYRVMSLIDDAKVDMYEALPVPFGLVRFGVAPDHPEVKNCEEKFIEVASSPNFTFVGNVAVGQPPAHPGGQSVQLSALMRHYDAVLFAYGASKDRTLGIPGESTLKRIYSAREFVGWYNGLPEFANLNPDLSQNEAVVVGQGNVALDVARILLEDVDKLRKTDIANYALDALAGSQVKRVRVVGRRGPMQAAFTIKELRELLNLPDVAFDPADTALIPSDLKALPRARKRLMELLVKGPKAPSPNAAKSWSLDFCLSPTQFHPDAVDPSAVGATTFQHNSLSPDAFDTGASAIAEDRFTTVASPLLFKSIGYKSIPIPEFDRLGILFDQRKGVVGSDGVFGRVMRSGKDELQHFSGLYCAGWVKRGPTGVIASTMEDAFATAGAIAEDWKTGNKFLADSSVVDGRSAESDGWDGVKSEGGSELASSVVDWQGWLAIDKVEKERGHQKGKEREKFTNVEQMLPLALAKDKR